jgi:RsiW-degrading membrane proteinase PrsW (M82 family)
MRLTYNSLYAFLFVFFYVFIITSVNRDHHPTMVDLVFLALTLAAGAILIGFALRDSRKPKVARKVARSRSLCAFLLLFLSFFFRLWSVSSYHPIPNPALWAFVAATIAAIVESFGADRGQNARPQK